MTVTYVDSKGKIKNLAGNLTTPAGVYFTTASGSYHGAPSFVRRTQEQVRNNSTAGITSSMHAREINNRANTNGCTGLSKESLKDLKKVLNGYSNVPTYILPSNKQNKFFIRNNQLQFKSHDINKTPSYNTIVSNPINKIIYDVSDLGNTQRNILKQFSTSLITNKKQLQKDLGVNNDTYNELALNVLGILGVESTYGQENNAFGNFIRAGRKLFSSNNSSPDYKSKYDTYKINGDNNSIGLTQIRMKYLSNKEKQLFKKYNITKDDLVHNPYKAAIASMIKLSQAFKDSGNNLSLAVKRWNAKPSYYNQVMKQRSRFKLYSKY